MALVIPVIHTTDIEQVKKNIEVCARNGVNDVFLISHRINNWKEASKEFESYFNWIKEVYPTMNVGINYLQLDTYEAMIEANRVGFDYIWADKSYLDKDVIDKAEKINQVKGNLVYFGAVSFKYQKPPKDLEWTCKNAYKYIDVVTTSGEGTGKGPTTVKVKKIKELIDEMPLAIASGIDSENAELFNPYTSYYLVASSITDNNEYIIEDKLKELLNKSQ